MNRLRSLFAGVVRARPALTKIQSPNRLQKFEHHDGPVLPFDNMPFSIPNRYVATAFFCVFFGIGLWAPFIILWYSMAKRTL